MKLLTLLLLLGSSTAEVVQSFKKSCPEFFLPNPLNQKEVIIPTILVGARYKQICQRWKNKYRFATLYDTKNKIPVYSAYTIKAKEKPQTNRKNEWKFEPQLESEKRVQEMLPLTDKSSTELRFQARKEDFGSLYTIGHVFPKSYAADQEQADSSFTLTNTAPQSEKSNGNWEREVETPMLNKITSSCVLNENNPAYIVTGVIPGEKWLSIERGTRNIEHGLNVPSHYWTAFTCIDKEKKRISHAYLAKQSYFTPNGDTKFKKTEMTVDELEEKLEKISNYGQKFVIFKKIRNRKHIA